MDNADEPIDSMAGMLWPSPEYYRYLERLKQAIGQQVFIAEINVTAINLGVKLSDQPLTLLAIVDFPRPDPYRKLCPHLLVFDDGRGINLGHIARISVQAFDPAPEQLLYENSPFMQEILFAPRTLSRASIQATSTALLAEIFGDEPGRLLAACPTNEQLAASKDKAKSTKRLK